MQGEARVWFTIPRGDVEDNEDQVKLEVKLEWDQSGPWYWELLCRSSFCSDPWLAPQVLTFSHIVTRRIEVHWTFQDFWLWVNLQQIYILSGATISSNVPLFSRGAWLASLTSSLFTSHIISCHHLLLWSALDLSRSGKDYLKAPFIVSHWLKTLPPYQIHCMRTELFARQRVRCGYTHTKEKTMQGQRPTSSK